MKIAVACDGIEVSPHFGRCEKYLVAEIEEGNVRLLQWLENPGHEPGALPELMRQEGVAAVVCGGAGPRAQHLLAEHGIELIMGVSGEAVAGLQALAQGSLQAGESACDHG